MDNLTAATYAAILDPEHQQKYWWTPCWTSPDFGGTPVENLPTVCKFNDWYFIGPPDLHTAREHAWRGEDWLEARGIGWDRVCIKEPHITETWTPELMMLTSDTNHAAAIAEAVRRVNDGQK